MQPGTKLGSYTILSAAGKGGMGEVYRARDTKLDREVAIKTLPEAFAHDAEGLARFEREARLLASVNHPNIAAIYGLEESNGKRLLVLELVEGETLAERLKQGAVPVDESLRLGIQIADALDAAHGKGVIHRDLKPGNIMLTREGKVKVLDFGLAKAFGVELADATSSNSPTLSMTATQQGVILGTAAYMSPEQARGKTLDKRTDIWAFGCVLYELLAGRPAFGGETVTEILGSVMLTEPDWSALPGTTPAAVRSLLRRCLRKDAQQRPKDAGDLRIEMEEARTAASPAVQPAVVHTSAPAPSRWRWALAAGVIGALLAGAVFWTVRPAPVLQQVSRSVIPLASDETIASLGNPFSVLALSPDGSHLAYLGTGTGARQIYIRAIDTLEARPLSGTDGAGSPFFSPDGQWVGFFTAGGLKKVSISGGAVLTLSPAGNPRGGTWGLDDSIIFSSGSNGPLLKVSAAGGEPQRFTTLQQGESSHRWPHFLPGGKTVLFTVGTGVNPDNYQIAVLRPGAVQHEIVIRGGTDGRYVPSGHLVYYRSGTLMAVPFDPDRLELRGTPAPVQEGVLPSGAGSGAGQFSFSERGALVYIPGIPQQGEFGMVWVDRNGREQGLPLNSPYYTTVRLSPDGQRSALVLESDIWVYDLSRDTLTRLTFEGVNVNSQWTPDGKRIAFNSTKGGGPPNIYWKLADGTGPEERLTTSQNLQTPASFTPDGKTLMYGEDDPKTLGDFWVLPLDGERKPRPYLQTPFDENTARISPDGRWVAYLSDESGRNEIYVRPFPDANAGKWQISTDGGAELWWAPSGKELFYRTGVNREKMMVVDIQAEPSFTPGRPRLLFQASYFSRVTNGADYAVSPDGQRFLMIKPPEQQAISAQIHLVQNWFEELKQKVPVR